MGNSTFDHEHLPTVQQYPVLCRHFLARLLRERGVYNCKWLCIVFFIPLQGAESLDNSEITVSSVYKTIWDICKLKRKYR